VLASLAGLADDVGQVLTPSVADGLHVPLLGPFLGLLAGPVEASLEDLANVLGMEGDLELTFDQLGDPTGGPQFGSPAVVLGPLLEMVFQLLELGIVEPGLGSGVRLGGEFLDGVFCLLHPGIDGGSATAKEVGHIVGGFPLSDEFDGPDATTLEFFCGADGSHTH
jgi:hypothetical protein